MKQAMSPSQIWKIPLLLSLISAIGMICALLGDGIYDWVSWFALSVSPTVALVHILRSVRCCKT